METMSYQLVGSPYQDYVQVLQADIQHANDLAAALPTTKGGTIFQMKLVYNDWAPLALILLQWLDCSCTRVAHRYLSLFHILVYKVHKEGRSSISPHGRKATVRDFYSVILPSLQRLQKELEIGKKGKCSMDSYVKNREGRLTSVDLEREDECGICLEPCAKVVLPTCCHAMCVKCYRKWHSRSECCPFCRGNISRVHSEDLWVLTCQDDVVDPETVSKEELLRLHLFLNSLPKDDPDTLFLVYYEYLI